MNEIEHDGQKYILKSDIENIIKERISKVASRANAAESKLGELETQLESNKKSLTSVDLLNTQLTELKSKLEKSETRFERYQSISKHGLTDPEIAEAVEAQYDRAQSKLGKKDKMPLSEWLDGHVANPTEAPKILGLLLQTVTSAQPAPAEAAETPQAAEAAPANLHQQNNYQTAPRANANSVPPPQKSENYDHALKDGKLYREYRDKIKQSYYDKRKKRV